MIRDESAVEANEAHEASEDCEDWAAAPTDEEIREAALLREALEASGSEQAGYAEALRSAYSPAEIAPERLDDIVARAVSAEAEKRKGRVIRVAFGGSAAVLAMAAAVLLFLRLPGAVPAANAPLMVSARSTQDLFDEPFPRTGGTSERVDRIASARARDLRQNRYAAWGVR